MATKGLLPVPRDTLRIRTCISTPGRSKTPHAMAKVNSSGSAPANPQVMLLASTRYPVMES